MFECVVIPAVARTNPRRIVGRRIRHSADAESTDRRLIQHRRVAGALAGGVS
jgi:hypothetical protein